MKKIIKAILWLLMLAVIGGVIYFFTFLPVKVDKGINVVQSHAPYQVSAKEAEFHQSLRVADLHADTLLWKRDPAKRQTRGHTDFPRLREGGVALQVFATVTFVPGGMNASANTMDTDRMTLLTIAQGWPKRTWNSLLERALYQSERLHALERNGRSRFIIARSSDDLRDALNRRVHSEDILIGILATEGAHPLEGDIKNLDKLYDAGFRMLGLQHFFDNALGGSLHGISKSGLTPFGEQVVLEAVDKGMIIDVAHSSIKVVEDVLALTNAPIVVSHTGILSACDHPTRNIPDRLLREIAEGQGLIGIGYWEMAVCDTTPDGIAKMIIHGAHKFGVDHIALGSDFDGATTTKFDASELSALTAALLRQGMSEGDIRKVMGENQIYFFLHNLPQYHMDGVK